MQDKQLQAVQAGETLNLRPKTMFDVKGRARPSENHDNYLPQWSKDGDGFKKQFHAGDERRKNKVILRYTREELLALHVVSTSPPEVPEGTPVVSPDSLPPVANLPFDYEEIYKQWASNKDRNRQPGRGRGQPRNDNSTTTPNNNRNNGNMAGGRIGAGRTNGNDASNDGNSWDKNHRNSEDLTDANANRKWNDKRGGDDNWERGAKLEDSPKSGEQEDLWDDVDPMGGDYKDMGLSNFAEAAEQFRKEMDQMHLAAGRELRQQTSLESEDQFADSVEETEEPPMWDMPTTSNDKSETLESSIESAPASLNLASWSSFEQPTTPLRVSPPVDAWFYLDPQGLQQGPFKSAEMREWFEAGYFKPHLPIRFGHEGEFASLANHFRHGQIPFSSIPSPNPQQQLLQQQKAAAAAAAHHHQQQQLLLQKQQLEQQQYLANQLQQQRLLEQRRLQEERMRMELQRMELNHHAAQQQEQARLLQQFHYRQNAPVVGAVGSGWPRPTIPRENIISGARDNVMGGLGMYAPPPPRPQVESTSSTDFGAWNKKEDPVAQTLWNSTPKNEPELSPWGEKPVEESEPAWAKAEPTWEKEEPATQVQGWGKPEAPSAGISGWGASDPVAPQPSPKPWGQPESQQIGAWANQTAIESVTSPAKEEDEIVQEKQTSKEENSSGWEAPIPEPTSLKQIQQEEQEEMRRRLKPQMSKQPKPAPQPQPQSQPQPPAQEAQPSQPQLADMGQQLKKMLGVSNPSPPKSWGNTAAAPAPVARSLSLRDIQAEEERIAQQKRLEKPIPSSRWSSVVTGTTPTPAPTLPVAAPRPAPVEVKATPPKDRDATFWNFENTPQQPARAQTPTSVPTSGGNDDLINWSAKQVKKLGGTEDLTLIQYCATLEDPGEIRECLAAYLGSTPKVSAFATEFIQRKKQLAGKKDSKGFQKKKKGQKVDASLLGYSVGSTRDIEA